MYWLQKLLVLLDLLGTPGTYFYNYYPSGSGDAYNMLASGEKALKAVQHLNALGTNSGLRGNQASYFNERSAAHFVEDDHTPFLQRGSVSPKLCTTELSVVDLFFINFLLTVRCVLILLFCRCPDSPCDTA